MVGSRRLNSGYDRSAGNWGIFELTPTEPLALHHSWPLAEQSLHLELGCLLNCAVSQAVMPAVVGQIGLHHAGCWECDLSSNALTWSGGVYDIFGLPRGVKVSREEAVAFYREESRAAMERLRSYAIRHNRGFTIDAEIRPASGAKRRLMRLIAVPVCDANGPVRLHGLKLIV